MIEQFYDLKPQVLELDRKTLELCRDQFAHLEEIRDYNQLKMLRAFTDCGVEARHFLGSTGYGVWDDSRNKLEEVFSRCMGAEDALVRPQFMSGTHTLTVALFGLLRAGDTLLAATGRPYDTLEGVIGLDGKGKGTGTLMDYGVNYDEAPLKADFTPDYDLIAKKAPGAKVCHIQRSRGYLQRNAFDLATIRKIADTARAANPEIIIFVDNCYGEFVQRVEPVQVGADIMAGSLIKNAGGGIAKNGGYIAGKADLVEKCAYRATVPGLGREVGASLGQNRELFMGIFNSPHIVGEALKTAVFAAALFEEFGFDVTPTSDEERFDIIQTVQLRTPEALIAFCQGMQAGAPVDSFVVPEPWDMPGYDSQVIMAAGAFTMGSSIELSADAPLREPYAAWMQGGFNFHSAKAGVMLAAQAMHDRGLI